MARFLFLLSITFSPIGWEECFCQSWQVPQRVITLVLSSRKTLFEEWGMWHFVQFPSWAGLCFTRDLSSRSMVSPLHSPHRGSCGSFRRPLSREACGLWQFWHDVLSTTGQ